MKRDLINYYKKCTKQYQEMLEVVKSIEDKKEEVKPETLEFLSNQVSLMKSNCDRVGYLLYLTNKPAFRLFSKQKREDDRNIMEYFKSVKADGYSVLEESGEALKSIKAYIENGKI